MSDQYAIADCGFFTSVNSDRLYSADQMSNLYMGIVSNGVFPNDNNNLLVEAGGGMIVTVHSGGGIFGGKWFNISGSTSFEVPFNGSPHTRVDSIIVRIDSRTTERIGTIRYVEGNSDSPPTINNINNAVDYRIANITVPQNAASISASNIDDLRGSSECPWVSSLTNNSTTATLGSISKSTFDNLSLNVGVVYTAGLIQNFLYSGSAGQPAIVIAVSDTYVIIIGSIDGAFSVYGAAGARGDCEGIISNNSLIYKKIDYFEDLETDVTLAMLGTSTYTSTGKIYYITLDEDVLYTGQPAGFKVKLTNIGDTQYLEAQNGKGIYQRTYTSGTGWSEFTNPVADLQSTVGTLNTQLENALNGGA